MQNPRLASRYAKSLLDLAKEQGALELVLADMELINQICTSNADFVQMLRSPIIKADKKFAILQAILGDKIGPLTTAFIKLLTAKGREFFLPEMTTAYAKQYKELKHINTVTLTTAVGIDDQLKQNIHDKIVASLKGEAVELHTQVDASLIGGFTLEVGDKSFDASIKRDLNDIKAQFTKNLYIADI